MFGMPFILTYTLLFETHGRFSYFFQIPIFFDKILVFRTQRLGKIMHLPTFSVSRTLLQFYPSDLDNIWYVPYIHHYAWTFFSLFFQFPIFCDEILVCRSRRIGLIAHLPILFVRHDLLPFWMKFGMCIADIIRMDDFGGFFYFNFFSKTY